MVLEYPYTHPKEGGFSGFLCALFEAYRLKLKQPGFRCLFQDTKPMILGLSKRLFRFRFPKAGWRGQQQASAEPPVERPTRLTNFWVYCGSSNTHPSTMPPSDRTAVSFPLLLLIFVLALSTRIGSSTMSAGAKRCSGINASCPSKSVYQPISLGLW